MSREARRAHREGAQAAEARRAEYLRCQTCKRKSALVKLPGVPLMVCRFCKHEERVAS